MIKENKSFKELEKIQLESVIKVKGKVVERSADTINSDLQTGEIEVNIDFIMKFWVHAKNFQCLYSVIKSTLKKSDLNIDF